MHLLGTPEKTVQALCESLIELKQKIRLCTVCFGLSDADICNICSDSGRDAALICVVAHHAEMVALEKSGSFEGRYHILQGVLSPMEGIGPDEIRIAELMTKLETGKIREVILALSTNVEGETTAAYIRDCCAKYDVRITRIASGVPVGGDLKYVDQVTLKKAMEGRHAV